MIQEAESEKLMTQYLLGELGNEEKAQLEERCLADYSFFESVLAVEDDLINDYLRGRLSPSERKRFEQHFLASPKRKERVELAKAILQTVSQVAATETQAGVSESTETVSWWQSLLSFLRGQNIALSASLVAALILIAVAGSWAIIETRQTRQQLVQSQKEQAALRQRQQELERQIAEQRGHNEQLVQELERTRQQLELFQVEQNRPPGSDSAMVTFLLTASLRGGADEPQSLAIPSEAKTVQFQLMFETGDYSSYRAVLQTTTGDEVWSQDRLKARRAKKGQVVNITLPATRLPAGDYLLILSSTAPAGTGETVGAYHFRVSKR